MHPSNLQKNVELLQVTGDVAETMTLKGPPELFNPARRAITVSPKAK